MTIGLREREKKKYFDPRRSPGLVAWYDSILPSGFGVARPSDGSALSVWKDLSGNGWDVWSQSASNTPRVKDAAYRTGAPFGILFDGTSNCYMQTTTNPSVGGGAAKGVGIGATPLTLYALAWYFGANAGSSSSQLIICYTNSTTPGGSLVYTATGTIQSTLYDSSGTAVTKAIKVPADTTAPHLYSTQSDIAGNGVTTYDGTPTIWNTVTDHGGLNGPIRIGYPSQALNALVSAGLIFKVAHDAATRRRIINWLGARYGIPLSRP